MNNRLTALIGFPFIVLKRDVFSQPSGCGSEDGSGDDSENSSEDCCHGTRDNARHHKTTNATLIRVD
ncbi:MAG: hypothetical protein LBG58_16360 [Planctomycetaceae bacterium]|nr:hypothetical protein [Planctomycetaceae bacterium]